MEYVAFFIYTWSGAFYGSIKLLFYIFNVNLYSYY